MESTTTRSGRSAYDTHVVSNQVPPMESLNLALHPALREALIRESGEWGMEEVTEFGARCGSREVQRWSDLADRNRPILHTHDRYGHRIDEVEYDPSYHHLMELAITNGLHAGPWADDRRGAHVVRAAKVSVWAANPAVLCPVWMSYAAVPALRHNTELATVHEPLLTSCAYVPGNDVAGAKAGITAGMSMTEKQGGSDLRAGTTQASQNSDGSFSLTGHKWFTSAPMSDIFLVLAQAPGGLSCFLLPRVLPDGSRNRMFLQRLKDKLGNHANASSEVEYHGATAWLVGAEGRGVATIMEMVGMGRLDVALGSATLMRVALTHATHHAQHRKAFGAYLIDQPLMRNVLADLAVEAEAATIVTMRLAGAADNAIRGNEREGVLKRIGVAATKYWVCKRATHHVGEAMECLGGNGYVEESGMPRLYREAPLAGIWEGSGNVSALDTLRALATPDCVDVLFDELSAASGADPRLDTHIQTLRRTLVDHDSLAYRSRMLAENICLALQGSLLVRHGDSAVTEAFLATRLAHDWGGSFGTLPPQLDVTPILQRATAAIAGGCALKARAPSALAVK
ncbi:acyl-CoA dehydrogenase family protein [Mycobacterium kubicae]|uniref:acyl-CoA dehydrogenase family protein n=1 Tax=Mycobacterium kubicae TaxID=120959 RepID=UPI0007FC693B|nr:acyl-CoA dehydrogenase family protein [Mycobacterium kubicae]OBK44051.1 DNA alkylation response protein [Mycobacterium kubicae]